MCTIPTTPMLSQDELETSCIKNGIYFCNTGFRDTVAEVLSERPDLTDDSEELKLTVMSRMLSEYLDYGIASETEDEADDGCDHSEMMAFRADICDAIAQKWCTGAYQLSNTPIENWLNMANSDVERMVMEHYFGKLADLVTDQLWGYDECKTIEYKPLATALGHTKIIEFYRHTAAKTADEFWDEVNTYFSGSVLDGSPFDAAEAEKYTRFTWDRYDD